jgi:membrane-associated protein
VGAHGCQDPAVNLFERLIQLIRDPGPQIASLGYVGMMVIVFLETGAMIFFLPGDSLLVVAGIYAAKGDLSLLLLNLLLIPCAIVGDATSYWIGAKAGPHLFNRPRSRFFRPEHVRSAHAFYEHHGGKAIVLARFVPIVRTFVPVVAGIARMTYRRFAVFNALGGIGWVLSMTLLGYTLGSHVPDIGKHVEKVIAVVIFASFVPMIVGWWRAKRAARAAAAASAAAKGPAD